jgi:drug/metabolite transporter (DMT)-like permease
VRTVTKPKAEPLLAASLAVTAWGMGPLLVRGITASSSTIVLYRLWLAQPVFIAVAYLTGGRLSWRMMRRGFVTGACFGASTVFGFEAFRTTSIANASLIPALQPVLVLLIAGTLFGERRTPRELVCSAGALGGVVLVVLNASHAGASLHGDLMAVANLVLFTAYFLAAKRARDADIHTWSFMASAFFVSALLITPYSLIASDDLGSVGDFDWLYLILLVLGPGLVGHGLMMWAHRFLDATVTSTMSLASPIISMVGAWMIFSQSLRPLQMAGAVVVVVGLSGLMREQRTDRARAAEAALAGDLLDG